MKVIRQFWFHLRDFSSTPYFIELVVISTISACVIQRMGVRAWGGDSYDAFIRSFIIGLWGSCTAAAGIIGFERSKGTLIYLVSSRTNSYTALVSVVVSASTFGLAALPLSLVIWLFPGDSAMAIQDLVKRLPQIIIGLLLLWVATSVIACVVAALFVLTPNATTYEGLILVPALFLSGTFSGTGEGMIEDIVRVSAFIFPPTSAVATLYGHPVFNGFNTSSYASSITDSGISDKTIAVAPYSGSEEPGISLLGNAALCLILCIVWMFMAYALAHLALRRARIDATLELF